MNLARSATHAIRTLAISCVSLLCFAAGGDPASFTHVRDIPLPGNTTRFDYQSIDPERNLLFIAHLGDSNVVVFDIAREQIVTTIPNVARVHGTLVVPKLHRIFASATGSNEVVVIDDRTLKIMARVPGGVYPDGIAYDPTTQRIFVSDEHGRTVTTIDVKSNTRVATITIGGDVGNSQYDPVSKHIFSADQTNNVLVEIDPRPLAIVHRYPLAGCLGSHGVYIDDVERRAYIACEDNAKVVNFDLGKKHELQVLPVGDSPDVLAFDSGEKTLYVACESGYLTTLTATAGKLRPLTYRYVAPAAHTIAIDQRSHLFYLPLENFNGKPVLRIMRINEKL